MTFSSEVASAIATGAQRYGLDPALVAAIVRQESGGNPDAIRFEPKSRLVVDVRTWSPFRKLDEAEVVMARPPLGWHSVSPCSLATEWMAQRTSWGLMQVLGATARDVGFQGAFLSALLDPAEGVEWGCRFLKRLTSRWPVEQAVSAYNWGHPTDENHDQYVEPVMRSLAEFHTRGV